MNNHDLFLKTATLNERISITRQLNKTPRQQSMIGGERRVKAWSRAVANGNDGLFLTYLTNQKTTREQAVEHLSDTYPDDRLVYPKWLENITWIKSSFITTLGRLEPNENHEHTPFYHLLLNCVGRSYDRLVGQLTTDYASRISPKAANQLQTELLEKLSTICEQTFYNNFQVFMKDNYPVEHKKNGRDQYKAYCKHLLEHGGVNDIFEEKPVLLKLIAQATLAWMDSSHNLVVRFFDDLSKLNTSFWNKNKKPIDIEVIRLEEVIKHQSDDYLLYTNECAAIRYTSRDITVDATLFHLTEALNKENSTHKLTFPKCLLKDTYGWIEFSNATPISRPYSSSHLKNAGAFLAFLKVLRFTPTTQSDFIGFGNSITLTAPSDIYAFKHNKNKDSKINFALLNTRANPANLIIAAQALYEHCLLEKQNETCSTAVDHSLCWENINTDEMAVAPQKIARRSTQVPTKNLEILSKATSCFIDGYSAYAEFLSHETCVPILLKYHNTLQQCGATISPKPNGFYSLLLRKMCHPKFLSDGFEWSLIPEIISRNSLRNGDSSINFLLDMEEKKFLLELKTPRIDLLDRKLINPEQLTFHKKITAEYDSLISKNTEWINKDKNLIETAINPFWVFNKKNRVVIERNKTNTLQGRFCEESKDIFHSVLDRSLRPSEKLTWQCLNLSYDTQEVILNPIGDNLYDGLSGIAIYLSAYARVFESEEAQESSLAIISDVFSRTIVNKNIKKIGICNGLGSIIYSLCCISENIGDSQLLTKATDLSRLLTDEMIHDDLDLDIVSGCAGTILALLKLYRMNNEKETLLKAVACGDKLLNLKRYTYNSHTSWIGNNFKQSHIVVPLTGFSHGAAGYAYALDALAKATSSQDFMHAAEKTVLYENQFYMPENNNWASIKSNGQLQTNGKKLSQWCYGSTGIGLGRIGQIKYGTSNKHHIEMQIENAKDGILGSKTHWADDSLCCGVASHIEFLSEISKLNDDADLEQHAQKNLVHLINERRHCGAYNLGDFKGYDIPLGMFRGVTGIGYTILRRLEKSLPNVLIFE